MKTTIVLLALLFWVSCCEDYGDSSYTSQYSLTVSGVHPAAVVDNHSVLEGLSNKKLDGSLVSTDNGRQLLTLLVACSLGNQDTLSIVLNGDTLDFFGETGLAPEWKTKGLEESSKKWVSACVLAHLSLEGLPVAISMRGRKRVLHADSDERTNWTLEEGAFFGNIFTPGALRWFACKGKDNVPSNVDRSCSKQDPAHPSSTLCGLTFVGDCNDVCRSNNEVCRFVGVPFSEVITVKLQR